MAKENTRIRSKRLYLNYIAKTFWKRDDIGLFHRQASVYHGPFPGLPGAYGEAPHQAGRE